MTPTTIRGRSVPRRRRRIELTLRLGKATMSREWAPTILKSQHYSRSKVRVCNPRRITTVLWMWARREVRLCPPYDAVNIGEKFFCIPYPRPPRRGLILARVLFDEGPLSRSDPLSGQSESWPDRGPGTVDSLVVGGALGGAAPSLGRARWPCRARWVHRPASKGCLRNIPGASHRSIPSRRSARDWQTSDALRRENAEAWLFEIRIRKLRKARGNLRRCPRERQIDEALSEAGTQRLPVPGVRYVCAQSGLRRAPRSSAAASSAGAATTRMSTGPPEYQCRRVRRGVIPS